jgi:hypothetical protein
MTPLAHGRGSQALMQGIMASVMLMAPVMLMAALHTVSQCTV